MTFVNCKSIRAVAILHAFGSVRCYATYVRLQDTLALSLQGVLKNKTQTFLTSLGVIIGVASVTLMLSLGASFQRYIIAQIESVGSKTMGVAPKGIHNFGADLESLGYDDFVAIQKLDSVTSVTPGILVGEKVTYKRKVAAPFLIGGEPPMFHNYGMQIDAGRFLDENDEKGAASNVVLAHRTAIDLFGDVDPLGKRVAIGDGYFTVVGVLKEVGSPLLRQLENAVVMPFSSAKALTGKSALSFISLQASGDVSIATADIKELLRHRHRIKNPEDDVDKDDFDIESTEQAIGIIDAVTIGLTIFLAFIAAISLVVGGIGIMNIMLASVLQRTHEIGLRKAVGATKRDILLQFLFEAIYLTVAGGFVGLLLGAGAGWVFTQAAEKYLGVFEYVLSVPAMILASVMAVGTGLIFGLTPARNAANMNPIEALRYE